MGRARTLLIPLACMPTAARCGTQGRLRVRALHGDGLASGPATPMTEAEWAELDGVVDGSPPEMGALPKRETGGSDKTSDLGGTNRALDCSSVQTSSVPYSASFDRAS